MDTSRRRDLGRCARFCSCGFLLRTPPTAPCSCWRSCPVWPGSRASCSERASPRPLAPPPRLVLVAGPVPEPAVAHRGVGRFRGGGLHVHLLPAARARHGRVGRSDPARLPGSTTSSTPRAPTRPACCPTISARSPCWRWASRCTRSPLWGSGCSALAAAWVLMAVFGLHMALTDATARALVSELRP